MPVALATPMAPRVSMPHAANQAPVSGAKVVRNAFGHTDRIRMPQTAPASHNMSMKMGDVTQVDAKSYASMKPSAAPSTN